MKELMKWLAGAVPQVMATGGRLDARIGGYKVKVYKCGDVTRIDIQGEDF